MLLSVSKARRAVLSVSFNVTKSNEYYSEGLL